MPFRIWIRLVNYSCLYDEVGECRQWRAHGVLCSEGITQRFGIRKECDIWSPPPFPFSRGKGRNRKGEKGGGNVDRTTCSSHMSSSVFSARAHSAAWARGWIIIVNMRNFETLNWLFFGRIKGTVYSVSMTHRTYPRLITDSKLYQYKCKRDGLSLGIVVWEGE